MFWLTTEALRTGNRRLELGGSLAGFMRELRLNLNHGGRGSPRARLHDQMPQALLPSDLLPALPWFPISCLDLDEDILEWGQLIAS